VGGKGEIMTSSPRSTSFVVRHSVLVSEELVVFFLRLLFKNLSPTLQRKYFMQKLVEEDSVCFAKLSFNLRVANSTRESNANRVHVIYD
jgi:hypothetical protein